jgi:hypothetical protein
MKLAGLLRLGWGGEASLACGPGVVSSPEISETRARPVMRGRKKGEGERGAASWGRPVRERERTGPSELHAEGRRAGHARGRKEESGPQGKEAG